MKRIFPPINTITIILLLIIFTNLPTHAQEATKSVELPDGATARLGKGHIYDMQYTEDGTRIAVATSIGIWIYDATLFSEVYLLKKHKGYPRYLAFSPDGNTLTSGQTGSLVGTIDFWDTQTGAHKREITDDGGVIQLVYSRDGKTLAIIGNGYRVTLLETTTWKITQRFQNIKVFQGAGVFSFAFSPENFILATGHREGEVRLISPLDWTTKHTFEGHEDLVGDVTFNTDQNLLASASFESIRVWNTETGEQLQLFDGIFDPGSMSFSPDGSLLASRIYPGDIRLYSVQTGDVFKELKGHTGRVLSIAFSSDLRTIASAAIDGTIRIWDIGSGGQLHAFENHYGNFTCLGVSADGKTVAAPTADLAVCLWDVETGKLRKTFDKEGFYGVGDIAFSPDGDIIATASMGKYMNLWNRETGELITTLKGHESHLWSAMFSPDGKTIATGSEDTTVRLWDVAALEVKHVLEDHADVVRCVAFSPDGATVASGSDDKTIRLWDANTGEAKDVLDAHKKGVAYLAYGPDGAMIASVDNSPNVYLWDAAAGELKRGIAVEGKGAASVAFHADGKVLAVGGSEGLVQLIDVNTGETLRKFVGHQKSVTDIAFASGGKKLVTRCDEGILYVWDIAAHLL